MTARLSLYQKAEQELYRLDRSVKAQFYDFCHRFRNNPWHAGLDLKPLKGDSRIHRAKIDRSYRALLTRTGTDSDGTESWLLIAVRHRKDVYDQLSVAVNRVNGEIEFVDLSIVGDSALQRVGISLTPSEPDTRTPRPNQPTPRGVSRQSPQPVAPATPLLAGYDETTLRDLGVAESLIDLALTVTNSAELDQLVDSAPLLSKDVLYGLASGMSVEAVRAEITQPVVAPDPVDPDDFTAALDRTTVTTADDALRGVLDEGDFRAWKVFLHPSQARLVGRHYNGPARVSGGPGTGKTIVALHRVRHLAQHLPPNGQGKPILLTTFTKNLATDLRARLASLLEPELMARVEIAHIDQLAARVVGENSSPGRSKKRIDDRLAHAELRAMLTELEEHRWDADFLIDEWEQVILGQSLHTRSAYFHARRAGRSRPLTRPERNQVWKLIEQFTARLDKLNAETWAQAAERAARFEIDKALKIQTRRQASDGGQPHDPDSSGARTRTYRYRHIIVDEAQDLRPSHWKMLRAMAEPSPNDLFITGDTHQRIYDNQVALGAVGINIRGRSTRLTLSYRTTKEILTTALTVISGHTYDDLDDGTDTLAGYRSVLHGPTPTLTGYQSWHDELAGLATTLRAWREDLSTDDRRSPRKSRGQLAVCVANRDKASHVMQFLADKAGLTCAELTKDGPRGDGNIHVGTMHRFKGLEYQRLAIVGVSDGIIPRTSVIDRYRDRDPSRHQYELRKARSLLFVAATRARDTLTISWHGKPSPFLTDNLDPGERW